jgi:hypothetical protein
VAECGADYSYNDDDVVIVLDSEEENEYIQASLPQGADPSLYT